MRKYHVSPATSNPVDKDSSPGKIVTMAQRTEEHVLNFAQQQLDATSERLEQLTHEWNTERALVAMAGTFVLTGTLLSLFRNRTWSIVPGVMGWFLVQHAVQGWCPPLTLLRQVGVRTADEIMEERTALKVLRGDFQNTRDPLEALREARLS
ncbi:DUF2892 domain-containing protein [Alicyclobacillaceae bacterium I2511]|nr:DUF2892 domain-containing protein [Alicyclobacillaceae bacterium I2511]